MDNVERLEKRIAFLGPTKRKWSALLSLKRSMKSEKPRCSLCYILCPIALATDLCYHKFLELKFAKRS